MRHACSLLGYAHRDLGDTETALELLQQSLEAWLSLDTPWGTSQALFRQAVLTAETGDDAAALELYKRCLEMSENLGDSAIMQACRQALLPL